MSNYLESNCGKNEIVVQGAVRNKLFLLATWIKGILFFWLLFIPLIKAIIKTLEYCSVELGITNKRVVGKYGFAHTKTLDAPLNKVQQISVFRPFWGKIFNYGEVKISTAAESFTFPAIKNAESFKGALMAQIEQYEEERVKQQAAEMANAMSAAIKGNNE